MTGCFKGLTIFVYSALAICTAVIGESRDPYLAAGGPTPLRFRLEVARLDPAKALPPLGMGDRVAPVATTNAAPTTVTEPPVGKSETSESLIDPAMIVGAVEEAVVSENVPANTTTFPEQKPGGGSSSGGISPQMLLRYFQGGTNEVLVPYSVDFTPPVPEKGARSSATYISE